MGRLNHRFPMIWAVPAPTYMGKCWNHDFAPPPPGSWHMLPGRPGDRSRPSGRDMCRSLPQGQRHFGHELRDARRGRGGAARAQAERAIEIVERALKKYGPPVYVRHEIVHNKFVVDSLKAKGAIFVEELSEVPQGAVTIFSAHGVAKSVVNEAGARQLPVLDATCPLVTKVHNQGKRYVAQGRVLILVGHAGHPEVEGTLGQIDG